MGTVAYLWGVPYTPNQNFEAKVLNFAVLSFGPRIFFNFLKIFSFYLCIYLIYLILLKFT